MSVSRFVCLGRVFRGIVFMNVTLAACSMSDIVGESAQSAVQNTPDAVKSADGALNYYRGVVGASAEGVAGVIVTAGVMTDELRPEISGSAPIGPYTTLDRRHFPEGTTVEGDGLYATLTGVRIDAQQARGVLAEYGRTLPLALVGHLYAIEGLMDVLLADLYCSGIPLGQIRYDGGYTLSGGRSTEEVYRTAIEMFDSAIVRSADSTRLLQFAQLGKARALAALGELSAAKAVVQGIDNDFQYAIAYTGYTTLSGSRGGVFLARAAVNKSWSGLSMSDSEGGNGLRFVTSGDPRTDTVSGIVQPGTMQNHVAKKYGDMAGNNTVVITSAVEARLIEAEAALANNDVPEWLRTLNALRTTCQPGDVCATPAPPGIGKVAGLSPLQDPGLGSIPTGKTAHDVRVDLLFRERAFWLYLTGHRQGDLRRLMRLHDRTDDTLYPTGVYLGGILGGSVYYGRDVNLPVPLDEKRRNPLYHGCINRNG